MTASLSTWKAEERKIEFEKEIPESFLVGWVLHFWGTTSYHAFQLTRTELEALRDGAAHALANYDLPGDPAGSSETSKPAA